MKKLLLILSWSLIIIPVFSQKEFSLILGGGLNKMSGDIGGDNFNSLLKNDLGGGFSLGIRYTLPSHLGFRIFGDYSKYNGKDNELYNGERILSFKSNVASFGGQLEYIIIGNSYTQNNKPHSLYLFGGGNTAFSKAVLDDQTKVSENAGALFLGAGYQYRLSQSISLGTEAKQILFLSDKIDGFYKSVAGNQNQDTAFDLKITISYFFPQGNITGGRWEN